MLQGGLAITPDVIVVAIGLSAVLVIGGRFALSSWLPLLALLLAYELMRGLADDAGFPLHMQDLIVAERLLTLGHMPVQMVQEAFYSGTGLDPAALLATAVYIIHFIIPIVTGLVLWLWRRAHFHDYMAGLIVLSLAAFVTYLLLPAAPPWYAAEQGLLAGADGAPTVEYLKPEVFAAVAGALGLDGTLVFSSVFYTASPNDVAAWPSLHVAYPFLAFLFLRRAFGRIAWTVFAYTLLVAFSVVYLGDHWVHDCIAGLAFAYIAYYAIVHTPDSIRIRLDRFFDDLERMGRRTLAGEPR
jgi:membrane-associated phospholipid phosphatase